GKEYSGFRYKDAFYDSEGISLARQFVKSPLSYSYISSGYANYRVNPVTRKVETHFAIDYAASAGTPVIATAKGDVVYAANKGGLGITVELQHSGGYKTQYAHLSKIAKNVKNNATVEQGDVIGYVGSTGISTGPHLQYAMYKNGEKVNPLAIDTPKGESVGSSEVNQFNMVKDEYMAKLP
ncbi:MAG: peptidoglycan DD-metalloendopeptidase family protein, partial [Patescibacteria group bacterium]